VGTVLNIGGIMTGRGKPKNLQKNLPQYLHKSHTTAQGLKVDIGLSNHFKYSMTTAINSILLTYIM
jgi:hypothetical protein